MAIKLELLYELIEPAVQALGLELWGIEYRPQPKRSLLRIYIDSPNGIHVDDCAAVSHQVSGVLEVEDPIAGEYTLEVSSPGVDRPLFTLEQYQDNVGQWLNLKLRRAFEGRRNFKGVIKAVEGDEVVIQVDNHEFVFPIELIEKSNVIGQIDANNRNGKV